MDCKLFLTTKRSLENIAKDINDLLLNLGAEKEEIYYELNEDYDKNREFEFPNGFLFFKYVIFFESTLDKTHTIAIINNILKKLWSENIPAIAACDYENELIKNGGYRDSTIPFPTRS